MNAKADPPLMNASGCASILSRLQKVLIFQLPSFKS